jgi:hypothetical protein
MSLNQTCLKLIVFAATASIACMTAYAAPTFTVQTFATGTTLNATQPDSVAYAGGSIWLSYQNGADSTGLSGSSTVVRYSTSGTVLATWSIAGNVDGLRIDPSTGLTWALQNNDGNSTLTAINPSTLATNLYTYGSSYTNAPNRGFDDVEFRNSTVFLSETNPASTSDPVVLRLTTGLSSPLQVAGILNSQFTGVNLATGLSGVDNITDSDSLILAPNGDLVLTGEADQQLVFIHNPGQPNQSESFINLLGTNGLTINGFPDDSGFVTAKAGYFLVADTGANIVYKIWGSNLTPGDVYVDVGDEFGVLDLSTGIVTPIFTGTSPHGLAFVPTPEPSMLASMLSGLAMCGGLLGRRMRRAAK